MRTTIKISIYFFILIFDASMCFSNNKVDKTQILHVDFNDITTRESEKSTFNEYISPIVASIVSLLGIFVGYHQLKKQIKSTRDDILKQYDLEMTLLLMENISNLLLEIKDDNGNFAQGKWISREHCLYELRTLLLLNPNNILENDLSLYIRSLSNGECNQQTTKEAIDKIHEMTNRIIINRIKL